MTGQLATSGRVEITLFAGITCVLLIGELKHDMAKGEYNDALAQMMVESNGTRLPLSDG